MRKQELTVGMILTDAEGIYQITGFQEIGNTFCTVRKYILDDEELDKCRLGEEQAFTREEVKRCLRHMTDRNVEPVVKKCSGRNKKTCHL